MYNRAARELYYPEAFPTNHSQVIILQLASEPHSQEVGRLSISSPAFALAILCSSSFRKALFEFLLGSLVRRCKYTSQLGKMY